MAILNRGAFSLGASTLGNTLGDTGVTGSRIVLAGIGGVTLSQITGPVGGTIVISGGGGGPGGAFSAGVSGGNTAGDTGATGTRLVFAGGSNVTLSQATDLNGGSVTINAGGGAETQTAISGIVASDATYTSGTVQIVGAGDITVASGTGQRIIISGSQSVQPETQTFLGAIGNSETTFTSGTVRLSELGAVTLRSTTGQAFQISVDPQSVQPETQTFVGGVAGSNATYTSGTVNIVGSGIVTVQSGTGQRVIINASQSVQPETQTFIAGVAGSDTTYSSGTVRITGVGGGVTVSSNTGQRIDISVAAPVAQSVQPGVQQFVVSNTTFSSGTVSISGFGDVTVNTAANIIRISAPVQTVESQSIGMSNIGNTSGTTGIASGAQVRMLFAGGNNVTLSQSLNGASGTLTISAASQTVQTQNLHNVTISGNTSGALAAISSGTLTLAGGNNITLSQNGNAVTISGPNVGGAQTGISGLANSQTTYTSGTVSLSELGAITIRSTTGNQFQLSVNPQTGTQFSAGISGGNTAGDTGTVAGRVVLAGGANITLSGSTNGASETVSIVGPTQTVESQSIGMSNLGNTSGTTGIASGGAIRFLFAGGNNITLSQSINGASGTITISAPNLGAGAMSAGVSTGGNTAGATGITGTQMVLVGTGPISLSQTTGANGGTVSIDAPATSSLVGTNGISISTNGSTISVMQTTGSAFLTSLAPFDESPMVTGLQGQGTLHFQPLRIPEGLQFDRVALGLQISNATNSSGSFTLSQWFGLYTRTGSSVSLFGSTSISTNFTGSGTVGSYSLYAGPNWLTIPWTTTVPEGDYYAGIILRSTTGGANHSISQLLLSKFTNSAWSGIMGVASATSVQRLLGQGHYSATTSAFPASVAFSQLIGSGSIALRSPVFHFRSGTV